MSGVPVVEAGRVATCRRELGEGMRDHAPQKLNLALLRISMSQCLPKLDHGPRRMGKPTTGTDLTGIGCIAAGHATAKTPETAKSV